MNGLFSVCTFVLCLDERDCGVGGTAGVGAVDECCCWCCGCLCNDEARSSGDIIVPVSVTNERVRSSTVGEATRALIVFFGVPVMVFVVVAGGGNEMEDRGALGCIACMDVR